MPPLVASLLPPDAVLCRPASSRASLQAACQCGKVVMPEHVRADALASATYNSWRHRARARLMACASRTVVADPPQRVVHRISPLAARLRSARPRRSSCDQSSSTRYGQGRHSAASTAVRCAALRAAPQCICGGGYAPAGGRPTCATVAIAKRSRRGDQEQAGRALPVHSSEA